MLLMSAASIWKKAGGTLPMRPSHKGLSPFEAEIRSRNTSDVDPSHMHLESVIDCSPVFNKDLERQQHDHQTHLIPLSLRNTPVLQLSHVACAHRQNRR